VCVFLASKRTRTHTLHLYIRLEIEDKQFREIKRKSLCAAYSLHSISGLLVTFSYKKYIQQLFFLNSLPSIMSLFEPKKECAKNIYIFLKHVNTDYCY